MKIRNIFFKISIAYLSLTSNLPYFRKKQKSKVARKFADIMNNCKNHFAICVYFYDLAKKNWRILEISSVFSKIKNISVINLSVWLIKASFFFHIKRPSMHTLHANFSLWYTSILFCATWIKLSMQLMRLII